MPFYILQPEVPGRFGKQSVFRDRFARPPAVDRLHYEFDAWGGDDLLTIILTYIGTLRLAAGLQQLQPSPSGLAFDTVTVTKSDQYKPRPDQESDQLPDFVWLKITGDAGVDDFGIAGKDRVGVADRYLVVSERVLRVLQNFQLTHCDVAEYNDEATSDRGICATCKDEPHLG